MSTITTEEERRNYKEDVAKETTSIAAGRLSPEELHEVETRPNGGRKAWLQVAGSFMMYINTWGMVNTFGVYQTYYATNPLWTASSSQISWIGSLQAFLLMSGGVFTGPLYDAGYFRHLLASGTVLVPLGFMMTSICETYWQTMLAQGVLQGLGMACLYVASVAILPQYFSSSISLANGVAAVGAGVGGVVYPIVFNQAVQSIGFGWANRILGFLSLACLAFSLAVMRPRITPRPQQSYLQVRAFTELPYASFTVGLFIIFTGFFGPYYYIQYFAFVEGLVVDELNFYLLAIMSGLSIGGVLLFNWLGDIAGPLNMLIIACISAGAVSIGWTGVHSQGGVVAFCVLYGFFSGAFVSLPAVAVISLTSDIHKVGRRMGQCWCVSSVGLLIGPPIMGAILDDSSWLGLELFSGLTVIIVGFIWSIARVARAGLDLKAVA
ncbi:hypothetical protein NLU13_3852 [Sarocladium strictum]|uniref:Major facilitator superfamily (MFS) profile domain-containing protein n=1 Tax=Sarocladium strictum TaxID=5046 RepID=A0AA39GI52_SARSR|nr:hypothetical protein NLU13_3852 [Sarocladium strictum]